MSFNSSIPSLTKYCLDIGLIITQELYSKKEKELLTLNHDEVFCALIIDYLNYLYNKTDDYRLMSRCCYLLSIIMGKFEHEDALKYRILSNRFKILFYMNHESIYFNIRYYTKNKKCKNCDFLEDKILDSFDEVLNPSAPIVPCDNYYGLCVAAPYGNVVCLRKEVGRDFSIINKYKKIL